MISIAEFADQDPPHKAETLSLLFEPCPTLIEYIEPVVAEPASSWTELIERIRSHLHELLKTPADKRIPAIIAAHPRLGAKKVDSALSQAEQASLQAASAEEGRQLADLNHQYEQRFPGLRYVVFVAGRPRSVIMENMRARIAEGDLEKEKKRAFDAMCDIAKDRSGDR